MSGPSHRRDDNSKQKPEGAGAGQNYFQGLKREVLDQPSILVASIADLLGKHGGEDAKRCADTLRRQGAMTGREFNRFIEGVSEPVFISEVLRAYSVISHDGIDVNFAQGVPALITLAQRALTSPNLLKDASQERLVKVFDRVLNVIDTSDDIAVRIEASVSKAELRKLGRIATQGFSDRKGYWECVEFLCALYPDKTTLHSVFQAIERVGSDRLQKVGCSGAGRCIAAVASLDYAMAFTFVAHTLSSKDRSEDAVLRRVALSGLALQDGGIADILGGFLASRNESEAVLACQVWGRVVLDRFGKSSAEQRAQIAQQLRSLIDHPLRETGDLRLHDAALTALMYTSPAREDIDAAGARIRARLAGHEPPPSSLVAAYAKALSQIEGEFGLERFRPLSRTYLQRLISPPSLSHHLGEQRALPGQADTDNVFKDLAVEIAGASRFEDVLTLCGRHAHLVNLRSLRERDNDSLSLFVDVDDAARFCQFYAHLADSGPAEFALVLLPELLSALDSGRDFDKERSGDLIGEKALEALKSITCIMLNDANARELALARMSPADWKFLSNFHKINIRDFPGSYPELALVVFALRSVLEGEQKKWQRDLVSWWRKVDDAVRNKMDSNALRFVSVVAERHRSGAVWDLISQVSLVTDDGATFSDIASGVVVRSERSIQKICDLVASPRGDDLARGFLLAQLMSRYVSESQREEILVVARRSLDEMGTLALDAITTVASLSYSVDDAALLFAAEPCLGLKESAYRVSCARAAAHVLLNREQRGRESRL